MVTGANAEMAGLWDGEDGDDWARDWRRYDRSLGAYLPVLLDGAQVGSGGSVLDVGCGTGATTRAAARAAAPGGALGIDLSSRMLARARELAAEEGVTNVAFVQGDAQVHPFEPSGRDVAVSRFGTLFFSDPVAAFANIGAALRPGGRLAMLAWRGLDDNEWLRSVRDALAVGRDLPAPPVGQPGPLGLSDPALTARWLDEAGFDDVRSDAVDQPFVVGDDVEDALDFTRGTGLFRGLTRDLDDSQRERALAALRQVLQDHAAPGGGVRFGSGAWLVTAQRRPR